MKDMHGDIVVEEEKILEVWRTHYEKLSNEEFPWDGKLFRLLMR